MRNVGSEELVRSGEDSVYAIIQVNADKRLLKGLISPGGGSDQVDLEKRMLVRHGSSQLLYSYRLLLFVHGSELKEFVESRGSLSSLPPFVPLS